MNEVAFDHRSAEIMYLVSLATCGVLPPYRLMPLSTHRLELKVPLGAFAGPLEIPSIH